MEESRAMNGNHENGATHPGDDASSLKAELDECRRYAETLHLAVYGGLENFPYQLLRDGRDDTDSLQSRGNGNANAKNSPLLDWQRCIDLAADQELVTILHIPVSIL